jgi:uncharacterized protein (DUF885 family)
VVVRYGFFFPDEIHNIGLAEVKRLKKEMIGVGANLGYHQTELRDIFQVDLENVLQFCEK